VAARAHHAEIGGARPGSMVPGARTLAEEGVAIAPTVVARDGSLDESAVRRLLARGPWPSRDPDLNIADLRAAIGALELGARSLADLAASVSPELLRDALAALRARSAARTRAIAGTLPADGVLARASLDDGTPIRVRVSVTGDGMHIDLSGSGPVHRGNLNAPMAVVRSAVLYALRVRAAVDEPLDDHFAPLNEGFLEPVLLTVPEGVLNPPFDDDPARSPAVFCGNTETSQRVTDALLSALGVAACSQGTMNNLTFGNPRFSTYETIGGGSGASPHAPGSSAVHCHMTNTRLTDAEVLERSVPLRVERIAVRRGSGGAGRLAGGDGMVRRIRALEPCVANLASQRRATGPDGADGGQPGAPGLQRAIRADGRIEPLGGECSVELAAGDAIEVETPGGGAWGPATAVTGP
jgi:5-oxoprolinase (ATP-hydrolysing)